jgi:hypothetical protein
LPAPAQRRPHGTRHQSLSATLAPSGHREVAPLAPEVIVPRDGADKQACEQRAVHRWPIRRGETYSRLAPIHPGDGPFARQRACAAVHAAGGDFLFVCEPSSRKPVGECLRGPELRARKVTARKVTGRKGRNKRVCRSTWLPDIPLRDGRDSIAADLWQIETRGGRGRATYRGAFAAGLPVDRDNAELAACGGARWKIGNESFNVLEQGSHNLERNFGRCQQNRNAVLVVRDPLAFWGSPPTAPPIWPGAGCCARFQTLPARGDDPESPGNPGTRMAEAKTAPEFYVRRASLSALKRPPSFCERIVCNACWRAADPRHVVRSYLKRHEV